MWAFSPEHSRWSRPKANGTAPSARKGHSLAPIGVELYIWGGCGATCNDVNVHVFDTQRMQWRTRNATSGSPPAPREGHVAAIVHGRLVIIGGCDGKLPLSVASMALISHSRYQSLRCALRSRARRILQDKEASVSKESTFTIQSVTAGRHHLLWAHRFLGNADTLHSRRKSSMIDHARHVLSMLASDFGSAPRSDHCNSRHTSSLAQRCCCMAGARSKAVATL